MRSLLLLCCQLACLGLSSAQDVRSDGAVHTIELSPLQGNVVQRQLQRRENLPLANYFLGTDLQVCLTSSVTLFCSFFSNDCQWYGTIQVGTPPQNL